MAAATRIISLNLGTHTIGLAEFRALPNGGLVLNGYRLREILVEPSNETARNAQIAVFGATQRRAAVVGERQFLDSIAGHSSERDVPISCTTSAVTTGTRA